MRENPPHILLTNYKMLDFLMLRPDDRRLWRHNGPETLRYLVLDELHTYDGAQGSDVACLIRRLRARLSIPPGTLCAVGTSATVGAGSAQNHKLIEFAKDVFGEFFTTDSVVAEDRQELDDVIPFPLDSAEVLPDARQWSAANSAPDYLRAAEQLWLGRSGHTPLELGQRLEQHWFTRRLLLSLAGRLPTLPELAAQLGRFHPEFARLEPSEQRLLLQSFLTLVSAARRQVEGQLQPFLACQTQLWVRELRHLTYHLGLGRFSWNFARCRPLTAQNLALNPLSNSPVKQKNRYLLTGIPSASPTRSPIQLASAPGADIVVVDIFKGGSGVGQPPSDPR